MQLFDCKIRVSTDEQSVAIQQKAFRVGYKTRFSVSVRPDVRFIILCNEYITRLQGFNLAFFNTLAYPEISAHAFMNFEFPEDDIQKNIKNNIMPNYKIACIDIAQAHDVQRKAFSLGYSWHDSGGQELTEIWTSFYLYGESNITATGKRDHYFEDHRNTEISPEDFLSDMYLVKNCKIELNGLSERTLNEFSDDLLASGIEGVGVSKDFPVRTYSGVRFAENLNGNFHAIPYGMFIKDGKTVMAWVKSYFDIIDLPEMEYADIYPIITANKNQNNNNMSEIVLKCAKAPQKAKNITVGEEYTGIYVDEGGNQVDTYDEADYFLCENNSGAEKRYKIDLFENIQPVVVVKKATQPRPVPPPPPPPPAKPTFEEFEELIKVTNSEVAISWNGRRKVILDKGTDSIDTERISASCGIRSGAGLDDLVDAIIDCTEDARTIFHPQVPDLLLESTILKKVIEAVISHVNNDGAFLILSTNDEYRELIEPVLDSICNKISEWRRNPNSGNNIKYWIFNIGG